MIGKSHGVEFASGIIALQDGGGIFPCNCGACLHLGPAKMGPFFANASFGDKIEYASFSFGITGIPVLHGGIAHLASFPQ